MEIGVPGVAVGHWSQLDARTGCTVVRLPEGTVASGEIRGGAPATREFALLEPSRLVSQVDAVVLTGGSAFGLAAADGVMAGLEAEGRGFPTVSATVPIVVAMALFDLGNGDGSVRPDAAAGRAAFDAATSDPEVGRVGAATGALVNKWRGVEHARPGGLGIATARSGELIVTAIVAVNAAGEIDDGSLTDEIEAGLFRGRDIDPPRFGNTTIGVVVTNGIVDPLGCRVVAEGAHDGLGRALMPPHLRSDGDGFVAAATGSVDADVDVVRTLAVHTVEQAVRRSVDTLDG